MQILYSTKELILPMKEGIMSNILSRDQLYMELENLRDLINI